MLEVPEVRAEVAEETILLEEVQELQVKETMVQPGLEDHSIVEVVAVVPGQREALLLVVLVLLHLYLVLQ